LDKLINDGKDINQFIAKWKRYVNHINVTTLHSWGGQFAQESIDKIQDVINMLNGLLLNMERLKAGARELIDGDSGYFMETFSIKECGNIGDFAMEICDELDCCSEEIEQAIEEFAAAQDKSKSIASPEDLLRSVLNFILGNRGFFAVAFFCEHQKVVLF